MLSLLVMVSPLGVKLKKYKKAAATQITVAEIISNNENKISFTPVPSRYHRFEFSAHSDGGKRPEGNITYMESEPEERNVSQSGD